MVSVNGEALKVRIEDGHGSIILKLNTTDSDFADAIPVIVRTYSPAGMLSIFSALSSYLPVFVSNIAFEEPSMKEHKSLRLPEVTSHE